MVAGEPRVKARERGLVELAGSGEISGGSPEQREIAHTAVIVRMVRTIDLGIAGCRASGQRERLIGLAGHPLDVGQADSGGHGGRMTWAEEPGESAEDVRGQLERILVGG